MHRRRTKDADLISLLGPLAALAVLITMLSPNVRQTLVGLGFIAVGMLGLLVLTLVGLAAYRYFTPSPAPESIERNIDWGTQRLSVAAPKSEPPTIASLIAQLHAIDWYQFEKLVELVYRKQGYSVQRSGGAHPDGGIDLLLRKDGVTKAVQCKQWKTWNVGVKPVREFLGALKDAGIDRGIFITLKGYTGDAKRLADKHGIEIVNETLLIKLLTDTDARFDPATLALLHDDQKCCPKCESKMVLRTASKGGNAGHKFWGCSHYPRCRFTLEA